MLQPLKWTCEDMDGKTTIYTSWNNQNPPQNYHALSYNITRTWHRNVTDFRLSEISLSPKTATSS